MTYIRILLFLIAPFVVILPTDGISKIYIDDEGKHALSAQKHSGFKTHTNYMGQNSHNYEYIKDGSAARRGQFYQRFELRDGDCFGNDGWNDCENDRERVEFSSRPTQKPSGTQCFAYSIKLDKDFIDLYPTNTDLGQVHQKGGPKGTASGLKSFPPLIQIGAKRGRLNFGWHELSGSADNVIDKKREYPLIELRHIKGKWTDISFCLDYENKRMDVWLNGTKVHVINKSPINFMPESTYFKYGIYRSFISRHQKEIGEGAKLPTQIVYYDEIRRGNSINEVDFNINPNLKPVD